MELTRQDHLVLAALEDGLPLTSTPYRDLGLRAGLDEGTVIETLRRLLEAGLISRLGIIVRHQELGYRANAMVVWDVADDQVVEIGRRFAAVDAVTLCYHRPRRPGWPYNLFCMVHGRERTAVCDQVAALARDCDVEDVPRDILFSRRRFKQRGAIYHRPDDRAEGRR
jgi:siroheme decarboxylase